MKYLLSLIFLLAISIANAETVIRYTHVYDIDANGAKLKCNTETKYLVFNDNKTQFYEADDSEGIAKGSPWIYKFEKTVNGIHYYYKDVDLETLPKNPNEGKHFMDWTYNQAYQAYTSASVLRNHFRENYKFTKGRIYVYFSNDFSKINWFVWKKGDKEYYVYEKYKEPAKRQAPSSLY